MTFRALTVISFVCFAAGLLLANIDYFLSVCPKNGDHALLSLSVLLAKDFSVLAGPYSRFHVFHPLPTYFYVYALLEPLTLFIATWIGRYQLIQTCLQLSLLALALLVLFRKERVDLSAPFFLAGCFLCLPASAFFSTWGPYTLAIPLLVFCIACSSVYHVRGPAWVSISIAYVFSVSNHLSGLIIASALLLPTGTILALSRSRRISWNKSQALYAATILLLAVSPALYDIATSLNTSNPAHLLSYLLQSRDVNTAAQASSIVVTALLEGNMLSTSTLVLICSLLGITLRHKKLKHTDFLLLAFAVSILLLSFCTARSLEGKTHRYLFFYLHVVPVLLFTVLGSSFRPVALPGAARRMLLPGLAIACATIPFLAFNQAGKKCGGRLIDFVVNNTRTDTVYPLVLQDSQYWATAAAVVNELTRRNVRVCVPPEWRFAFRSPLVCTETDLLEATERILVSSRHKAPQDIDAVFVRKKYAIWIKHLPQPADPVQ